MQGNVYMYNNNNIKQHSLNKKKKNALYYRKKSLRYSIAILLCTLALELGRTCISEIPVYAMRYYLILSFDQKCRPCCLQ